MIAEGQVVLFNFPQIELKKGYLRPSLVIRKVQEIFNDWIICMISTRVYSYLTELDEIISPQDEDFDNSGLKTKSVIRAGRLAVVRREILVGKIGEISPLRLQRIKEKIAKWILGKNLGDK